MTTARVLDMYSVLDAPLALLRYALTHDVLTQRERHQVEAMIACKTNPVALPMEPV